MHVITSCSIFFVTFLSISQIETIDRELRVSKNKGFLFYRKYSITERPCKCSTTFSCSCCVTVTLLYTKRRRELCSNFMYQRNGLNVDISLDTDTIKTTTITNYRPFKMCSTIPGSLFSAICVNVTELNQFPRSLTVCVRHEIVSKVQEWQIDYTCVSISTELPAAMSSTSNMMSSRMTSPTSDETPMTEEARPTQEPLEPDIAPEKPEVPPEMPSGMPPGMPSGMPPGMPSGMPPGMPSGMPPGRPPGMPSGMPPEMPPGNAMDVELVPPTEKPEVKASTESESLAATPGARKRRGTRLKLRKNKNIVNIKGDQHSESKTEKLKSPNQTVNASVLNDNVKLPLEATNFPPNNLTAADEPFDEILSVPDQTGRYIFHNRTEYFPNRIPPIIAKSMNSGNSTLKNETYYRILEKNLTYKSETDRIVFPD